MGGNQSDLNCTFGLRIYSIADNSPLNNHASVFTDIITGFNGIAYLKNLTYLVEQLNDLDEVTVTLMNIIDNKSRDIVIPLNINKDKDLMGKKKSLRESKGKRVNLTEINKEYTENLLGIKFDIEELANVYTKILRITNVYENSPGKEAGVIPKFDFVIYSTSFSYHGINEFMDNVFQIFANSSSPKVKLVLYNVLTSSVRMILLQPNRDWGDHGLLGIELGEGIMDDFRTCYDVTKEIEKNPALARWLTQIKQNKDIIALKSLNNNTDTKSNINSWNRQIHEKKSKLEDDKQIGVPKV